MFKYMSVIYSIKEISKNTTAYRIFIDLWANQYREKDIITFNDKQEKCPHKFIENNFCSVCNAEKTYIGE